MEIKEEKIEIYISKDGFRFTDRSKCIMHEKGIPYSKHYRHLDNCLIFEVTENHLKLIKLNVIHWCFFDGTHNEGYFYQDVKRPYGNSDWVKDIADALGVEPDCEDKDYPEDKYFSESLEYFLICHHIDMKVVMNILCQNLSIQKGKYKRDSLYDDWEFTE